MLLYVWRRSGDPGLAFGLRRLPFAMDDSGGATDTPAPTVQVVADLDDGTRPAGVRQDAWEQMRATGNVERLSQRPGLTSTPAGRAASSAGPRVGGPADDGCRGVSGSAFPHGEGERLRPKARPGSPVRPPVVRPSATGQGAQ